MITSNQNQLHLYRPNGFCSTPCFFPFESLFANKCEIHEQKMLNYCWFFLQDFWCAMQSPFCHVSCLL